MNPNRLLDRSVERVINAYVNADDILDLRKVMHEMTEAVAVTSGPSSLGEAARNAFTQWIHAGRNIEDPIFNGAMTRLFQALVNSK